MNAELKSFFRAYNDLRHTYSVASNNKDLTLSSRVIYTSIAYKTGYRDSSKKESVSVYIEVLESVLQHTDKKTGEITIYTGNQAKIRMGSFKDLRANLASQVLLSILFVEKAPKCFYSAINHSAKTFREYSVSIGNNTYSIEAGKVLSVSTDNRNPSRRYLINVLNKTLYQESSQPSVRPNKGTNEYSVINRDRYDDVKSSTGKKFKRAKTA